MAGLTPIVLRGSGASQEHSPAGAGETLDPTTIPWAAAPTPPGVVWCDGISDNPLNRLQCGSDGKLLITETAPPSVATLYVSTSEGDDGNEGTTRNAPLKTLMEALFRQVDSAVAYTILLKAGEVFDFTPDVSRPLASFLVETYGDAKYGDRRDGTWDACAVYRPELADDYARATIRIGSASASGEWHWARFHVAGAEFLGIKFRVEFNPAHAAMSQGGDNAWISCSGAVTLRGCDVDLVDSDDAGKAISLVDAPTVVLEDRNIMPNPAYTFGLVYAKAYVPTITIPMSRNSGGGSDDGCGVNTAYTPITENIYDGGAGELSRIVHGANWDANTGAMFNFHVAWDPRGSVAGLQLIPGFTFASTGLSAVFTDTSTVSQGTITGWHWYFGDGSESTVQNPTHLYADEGTYNVTLVVMGGDSVPVTTTASVSLSVSSGGSGGGGGGGSPGCVVVTNVDARGRTFGDLRVGDVMDLGDEETLEPGFGAIQFQRIELQPCLRITTENGAVLECSQSANLPTSDANLIRAINALGHFLGTRVHGVSGWSKVVKVESIGDREVNHLGVDNHSFWAGISSDALVLHHNLINKM